MFKTYYRLTKPGIIYGNLLTAAAGFLLASNGHVNINLLVAVLAGTSLVIASACVFNNYIDRGIDQHMDRTKHRALVSGTISGPAALSYAATLGIIGTLILAAYTNWLVILIGAVAFIDYVVLYGVAKRRSVHGTIVGSISGSAPIVAGYCAASGRFDLEAVILFAILTAWQMPHFFGIAMYRYDDYKAANLPVLPVKQGMRATKQQIMAYVIAFIIATSCLTLFGYTGWIYFIIMLALGLYWLWLGINGFHAQNDAKWGRKMFLFSLGVLLVFSALISVNNLLP